MVVDKLGVIRARYRYDPFGALEAGFRVAAARTSMRFSSKPFHRSVLYYYGYRFYNPSLQRWMNADSIGFLGGRNMHAFVGNDPLNRFDET